MFAEEIRIVAKFEEIFIEIVALHEVHIKLGWNTERVHEARRPHRDGGRALR